jgi:hypothetical protein
MHFVISLKVESGFTDRNNRIRSLVTGEIPSVIYGMSVSVIDGFVNTSFYPEIPEA